MKESNVHIVIESRIPEDGERYQRIVGVFAKEETAKEYIKSLMLEHIDSGDLDQLPNGGYPNSGGTNWNAMARRTTKLMTIEQLEMLIRKTTDDHWSQPKWSLHKYEVQTE